MVWVTWQCLYQFTSYPHLTLYLCVKETSPWAFTFHCLLPPEWTLLCILHLLALIYPWWGFNMLCSPKITKQQVTGRCGLLWATVLLGPRCPQKTYTTHPCIHHSIFFLSPTHPSIFLLPQQTVTLSLKITALNLIIMLPNKCFLFGLHDPNRKRVSHWGILYVQERSYQSRVQWHSLLGAKVIYSKSMVLNLFNTAVL